MGKTTVRRDVTPQPKVWPVCSTCGTPWALRRPLLVVGENRGRWLFTRDCKHRGTDPVLHNADGPL